MANPNVTQATSTVSNQAALSMTTTNATQLVSNAASSNRVYLIRGVTVANTDTSAVNVTVAIYRAATNSGTAYELASTVSVPAGSSLVVVERSQGVSLLENQSIYVTAATASKLKVFASWDEVYMPTPVTIPGQVTGLTATAGYDHIALSWTAPADNGNDQLSYIVESSTNGGASFATEKTVSGTSTTVTGYESGTSLIFRVAASNSAGMGAYSTQTPSVVYRTTLYWTVTENTSSAYGIGSSGSTATSYGSLPSTPTSMQRMFSATLTSQVAGTLAVLVSSQGENNSASVDAGSSTLSVSGTQIRSTSASVTAGQSVTVYGTVRNTTNFSSSYLQFTFTIS